MQYFFYSSYTVVLCKGSHPLKKVRFYEKLFYKMVTPPSCICEILIQMASLSNPIIAAAFFAVLAATGL